MPLFVFETDSLLGSPIVGGRFAGPIELEVFCDWIALEEQCDGTEKLVPEIQFPTLRHWRRVDWLCIGIRPTRAAPRGLRFRIVLASGSFDNLPDGIVGEDHECFATDVLGAVRDRVEYANSVGPSPGVRWEFRCLGDHHATNVDPGAYTDDDFIFDTELGFELKDGSTFALFAGPATTNSGVPPEDGPTKSLMRSDKHGGVNKRSVVFLDEFDEPLRESPCPITYSNRSFVEDFIDPNTNEWVLNNSEFSNGEIRMPVGDGNIFDANAFQRCVSLKLETPRQLYAKWNVTYNFETYSTLMVLGGTRIIVSHIANVGTPRTIVRAVAFGVAVEERIFTGGLTEIEAELTFTEFGELLYGYKMVVNGDTYLDVSSSDPLTGSYPCVQSTFEIQNFQQGIQPDVRIHGYSQICD